MIDIRRYLDARAFLVGLGLGFAGLCFAGWALSSRNMFVDYKRSNQFISAESQFQPTAREIKALVDEKLPPGKISVIIGGSSVFRGAGQSEASLWSEHLQAALGEKYQVLNLAVNGGSPGGQALYFSEMLKREGRQVIFLSDISLNATILPENGATYRHLYFDAYSRGYMPDFPERHEAIIRETYMLDVAKNPEKVAEEVRRARANRILYFDDFWTSIAYRDVFTIWTPLLRNTPFVPRVSFGDTEADCAAGGYSLDLQRNLDILGSLIEQEPNMAGIKAPVDATFPQILRPNIALVITPNSPFYVGKLTDEQRALYAQRFTSLKTSLASLGLESIIVPQMFEDQDYCDRVHYARSGGAKLAAFVAPRIVAKAKELGYE